MGETAKQARMMQIPPGLVFDQNDQSAHTMMDAMAAILKTGPSPDGFEGAIKAAYEANPTFFFQDLNQIGMVSAVELACVAASARASHGAVLEIGPYVGASTIAIALGLNRAPRPFFTVEAGGESAHETRGSDDILRDLKANLAGAGIADRVIVIEDWAQQACERLPDMLGGEKVGFMFVDADGAVDEHLNAAKHVLHDDCLLAFDDWTSDMKGARVQRVVKKLVEREAVIPFGLVGDGWFGRINGQQGLRKLSSCQEFAPDLGFAYWSGGVFPPTPSDDMSGDRSRLVIYEDGKPLGPGRALHAKIRDEGRGAYSHWRGRILFSTSDNSDPRTNGRRYTARYDGIEAELN